MRGTAAKGEQAGSARSDAYISVCCSENQVELLRVYVHHSTEGGF